MPWFRSPVRGLAGLMAVGLVAVLAGPAGAADHLDAPLVQADGRTDINDVYVFTSPTDPEAAVLVMTVNPLAGVQSGTDFRAWSPYVFEIDTDGDAVSDQDLYAAFGPVRANGRQRVDFGGSGVAGTGRTGRTVKLRSAGGGVIGRAFAGTTDDPFFFDLAAFRNGLAFCEGGTGANFFAGLNVSAIVLEVPKSVLGSTSVGVWGTTTDGAFGSVVDRMARPAINTVFIPSDQKDLFNATAPADDPANFTDEVVAVLLSLGNDQATADALAAFLLPDVLTVDLTQPTAFPNGRAPADDVIDTELGLITGGAVTTDCVANDSAFSATFPYLAAAN